MKELSRRILIVDDDADDRMLLEEALESVSQDLLLESKSSGTEALFYLHSTDQENLPTLIVLDYNMPGLNGREVLRTLKAHPQLHEIPTLIFSTSNSPSHQQECLSSGAVAYLVKPSNINDLSKVATVMLSYCKQE